MPTQRSPVIPYAHRAALIIRSMMERQRNLGPERSPMTASSIAEAMYVTEGWAIPTTHRVVRQMQHEHLLREVDPNPHERMQGGRPLVVTPIGRGHARRYLPNPPPTPDTTPPSGTGTTR